MAFVNPNKPVGLALKGGLQGSNWTGKGHVYCILSTEATYNYFPGDLVALQAGGDTNGIPTIAMCAAGATAVGVIMAVGLSPALSLAAGAGPYINPNNLGINYAPITKTANYYALVCDDPYAVYEIQEASSTATTNLTTSAVGLNANIHLGSQATATAGNVTTYLSSTYLDNHTAPTTTSTFNLRILRLTQRIDNHFVTTPSTGGGYQKWDVMINNHQYAGGTTAP